MSLKLILNDWTPGAAAERSEARSEVNSLKIER